MKVLFVLPDLGSGGAERVVSILASEFIKKGIDVSVLMLFGTNIHYEMPKQTCIKSLDLLQYSLFKRIGILRTCLINATRGVDKCSVFVMQDSCLKYVLAASFGLSIKVISSERNNPFIKGVSFFRRLKASIPYLLSDFTVFQTSEARSYYTFLSDKRCMIIPNPISVSNMHWEGGVTPEKLVSVCRLHKQKNLPMTLDVIESVKREFPNVHLNIYGVGELRDSIEELIALKGLKKNVTLCGATSNVIGVLSKSSIFISTSDFEGISNSMLEAMSIGMPIICTDCPIGGARMMLQNNAGILSPIQDSDSFSQKLLFLLKNEVFARELAQNAFKKSLDFTPEMIAKRWLSIVQ